MDDRIASFWSRFLQSAAAAGRERPEIYDTMQIGNTPGSADHGAALILSGRKTATSSHPRDYPASGAEPFVGALSIVLDGSGAPVAVVETVEVERRAIASLDAAYARDYAEWDGTAETLRRELAAYNRCDMSERLICERIRVIYPPAADTPPT